MAWLQCAKPRERWTKLENHELKKKEKRKKKKKRKKQMNLNESSKPRLFF